MRLTLSSGINFSFLIGDGKCGGFGGPAMSTNWAPHFVVLLARRHGQSKASFSSRSSSVISGPNFAASLARR
jgi:hypothetical protein